MSNVEKLSGGCVTSQVEPSQILNDTVSTGEDAFHILLTLPVELSPDEAALIINQLRAVTEAVGAEYGWPSELQIAHTVPTTPGSFHC